MSHHGSKCPKPHLFRLLLPLMLALGSAGHAVVYAQNEERVMAVVNGRKIEQRDVDSAIAAQLVPLEEQIYVLRKAALENLILRTILEEEAKKRGLAVEVLRQQLTEGRVEVAAREVEKLYAENASAFAAMSPDEAKERIRLELEAQARMQNYKEALLKLKERSRIELRLEEPRLPIINDDSAAPSKGLGQALVTITEFSDFQCPFCRGSQTVINQVLQNYKDRVRLIFKHLPLEELHPQAFAAARAAFCAGEQGAFWPYHDALFVAAELSPEVFDKLAAAQGLNLARFAACLKSEASGAAVRRDISEAKRLGISSTPTFIINGRLFRGARRFEEFQAAIERELKAIANGAPTQQP